MEQKRCWIEDKEIILSRTEWKVLEYLVCNQHKIMSKYQILSEVWTGSDYGQHIVTTAVYRLRKRIGAGYIEARPGFGYILTGPVEVQD